jgi:sec-independent protein translocase protein TatA
MGGLSIWHILLLGAVALLLFGGRFKISDVMGDLGKGITSFRKGLANPDDHPAPPPEPAPKKDTSANP